MSLAALPGSIAIAGAGIIGLSLAWRLAQAGFSVTVYDKGAAGAEASWAGAGMLAPGGEFETESDMTRLALESRALYPAFVEELQRASGTAIDLQQAGALDVAYSEEDLRHLTAKAEKQLRLGIPSKRLDAEKIGTFWPRLRKEGLLGGYFYPGDAIVNPREVVAALMTAAGRLHVRVMAQCAVRQAKVEGNHVVVETDEGTSYHSAFVLASGAWSGSVAVVGIAPVPASEPIRGHLIGYKQPEQTCQTIVRHGSTYVLQRANGLLIAGSSEERAGFNRQVDQAIAQTLRRQAEFLFPHLSEITPTETWTGFRPGSDALHIGRWHSPHVYLAYGHFRNGILLAPVTAERLAQEISANLKRL